MAPSGKPFDDQPVVFVATCRSVPAAKVDVVAVERDDGAPGGLVATIGRDAGERLSGHACNSVERAESGSLPGFRETYGLHCRPSAGNRSIDFSVSYVQIAATGLQPVTHGL